MTLNLVCDCLTISDFILKTVAPRLRLIYGEQEKDRRLELDTV